MTKVTLAAVANLTDFTTAATTINNNSAATVAAIEDTLSRTGIAPNQMHSTLDMNSNAIINLPAAVSDAEPVRKAEFDAAVFGAVTQTPLPLAGSVAQIKAFNTVTTTVAYLTASGLAGMFLWTLGDYSAQIAADPNGVNYIKANAIASTVGAWVRSSNSSSLYKTTRTVIAAIDPTLQNIAYLEEAGREGFFVFKAGNYAALTTADTNQGISIVSNSVASTAGAWIRVFYGDNAYSRWFGTVADASTDNSTVINSIITTFAAYNTLGYLNLNIEQDVKFRSKSLLFLPASAQVYIYITYFAPDDLTFGTPTGGQGTNEWHTLSVNSGYPGNVNGGLVAEWTWGAPLNPAFVVDVMKQVSGADAHLGAGQVRTPTNTNAARATIGLKDENNLVWSAVYQGFADDNELTAVSTGSSKTLAVITGPTTAGWGAHVPAVGAIVSGVTSGASGIYVSSNGTSNSLNWVNGLFTAGETLTSGGFTNSVVVASTAYNALTNPPFSYGINYPRMGVDIAPKRLIGVFGVGGRSEITRSQNLAQTNNETVLNPALIFSEGATDTTAAMQIVYDTSVAKASRILAVTKGTTQGLAKIGHVGAVTVHTAFGNGVSPITGTFGVVNVAKTGTGAFTINTSATANSSNWTVLLTNSDPTDKTVFVSATTNTISIQNYNHATLAAKDLAGNVHFMAIGDM